MRLHGCSLLRVLGDSTQQAERYWMPTQNA